MKRAVLLSLVVVLLCAVVIAPAQAQSPATAPAVTAPVPTLAFLTASPAEPAWDPALLATPEWALSLDPLASALATVCPPVCAGCPTPCLKSNCQKVGLCIHCC